MAAAFGMFLWLLDLTKDVVIAVLTGAYTGLVVSKYLNFEAQLQTARQKTLRLPDVGKVIFEIREENEARHRCMSLFLEEASFCKAAGYLGTANTLIKLGQGVEGDLMTIWRALWECQRTGNVAGVANEVGKVSLIVDGCLSVVEELKPDWFVLLFGANIGRRLRRGSQWAKRANKYIHGETDRI